MASKHCTKDEKGVWVKNKERLINKKRTDIMKDIHNYDIQRCGHRSFSIQMIDNSKVESTVVPGISSNCIGPLRLYSIVIFVKYS